MMMMTLASLGVLRYVGFKDNMYNNYYYINDIYLCSNFKSFDY